MPLCQTLNVIVNVSCQLNLNLIFAVLRKRMPDDSSTARAERQTLDVAVLSQIGRKNDCRATRRAQRTSNRKPADFLRRRQVSFHQGWRQTGETDIIEAEVGFITRKK